MPYFILSYLLLPRETVAQLGRVKENILSKFHDRQDEKTTYRQTHTIPKTKITARPPEHIFLQS